MNEKGEQPSRYKLKIPSRHHFKTCPLLDICNYADDCDDNDWEHCGVYVIQQKKPSSKIKWVCKECGYSGNSRDIVCPECHNSLFKRQEEQPSEPKITFEEQFEEDFGQSVGEFINEPNDDEQPSEPSDFETGWINDIFSDFLKDSTYHLEDNLPVLAEVLAKECYEYVEKPLISEFLEDLDLIDDALDYKSGTVYKTKEKWQQRLTIK